MESTAVLSRKTKGVIIPKNTLLSLNQEGSNMISCFNNIKSPTVIGEIHITDFIECIKSPELSIRRAIDEARDYKVKGETESYKRIKEMLPCFTLNFSFDKKKHNSTIKAPTGFIYIDIDSTLDIDFKNPLIYASWKSLSGQGRGVLVKVENLSNDNFKTTYFEIAKSLNIDADKYAAKSTQYNVHSYDEDIYLNTCSTTWFAKVVFENPPTAIIYKREKEKDVEVTGANKELIYNNIADFDFRDSDYIFFPDEKEPIAQAYIPHAVRIGGRNQIISAFATQMRALNPHLSKEKFKKFIINVNRSRCSEPLKDVEVISIVNKVLKMENIELIYNKPRRIIFNPKSNLSFQEKMSIFNKSKARLTIAKTKAEIKNCLDNWSINNHGKVTQKQLAKVAGKNIKTIEKYYKEFKEQRDSINNNFKT